MPLCITFKYICTTCTKKVEIFDLLRNESQQLFYFSPGNPRDAKLELKKLLLEGTDADSGSNDKEKNGKFARKKKYMSMQ